MWKLSVSIFTGIILLAGALLLYGSFLLSTPLLPGPGVKEIEIEQGTPARQILDRLRDEDLIRSVHLSYLYIRFKDLPLKSGFYRFTLPADPKQVLDTIMKGEVELVSVTIPEGLNRFQVATLLEEADITSDIEFNKVSSQSSWVKNLDPLASDCEGFIFPDTYRFARDIPARRALHTFIDHFRRYYEEKFRSELAKRDLPVHTWVIIASLVEAEAQVEREKPIIAAVFYNRLKRGMRLQCDPTIRYALLLAGENTRRLGYKELKFDHAYNTYIYSGLPPGPIGNPGLKALAASLEPAETRALYFVSKNNGTHAFSNTLREHNNMVNIYQRRR